MNVLRIHLDEDADAHALLNGLRHRGGDVTSSRDCGLTGRSDDEQLTWASEHGRILYTYNASDFCRLHADLVRQGRHHAGIIVGDQQAVSVGEELRRFISLSEFKTAMEMRDILEFLGNWRT